MMDARRRLAAILVGEFGLGQDGQVEVGAGLAQLDVRLEVVLALIFWQTADLFL